MAIAFWTDTTDREWEVVASGINKDINIQTIATPTILGTVHNINLLSVSEVVHQINALNLDVKATPLIECATCDLEITTGTIDQFGGSPALMEDYLFAYYENDTKVFLERPDDVSRSEDWFSVINASPVRYTVTDVTDPMYGYELTYNIGERSWQPFASLVTSDLEELGEPVAQLSSRFVSVRHGNVTMSNLRLKVDNTLANAMIADYDSISGILRFNRDVVSAENITVDYTYDPEYRVTIDAINMNPGQLHLPDAYRLFVGVYIIPRTIRAPGASAVSYVPNIGYVIANTVAEVVAAVDNMIDGSSGNSLKAKLLGVYQSNSRETLPMLVYWTLGLMAVA